MKEFKNLVPEKMVGLLRKSAPELSASEQAAVIDWFAEGHNLYTVILGDASMEEESGMIADTIAETLGLLVDIALMNMTLAEGYKDTNIEIATAVLKHVEPGKFGPLASDLLKARQEGQKRRKEQAAKDRVLEDMGKGMEVFVDMPTEAITRCVALGSDKDRIAVVKWLQRIHKWLNEGEKARDNNFA